MPVTRVHSSDTQVFVNSTRLLGVQSVDVSVEKSNTPIRSLSRLNNTDYLLNANQKIDLSLTYHAVTENGAFDPFFSVSNSEVLSVEYFDFEILDNAGRQLISGAYLSNYSLNLAVGQVAQVSISYEADSISFDDTDILTPNEQSSDSYSVYSPKEITVSGTSFDGQVNSSNLCIQSADISFAISREPITTLGTRTPRYRYPQLPIEGSIDLKILKNQVTGVDLSSLVLDKGSLAFYLRKANDYSIFYNIHNCSLISISESNSLDGNAMLDFKYSFSLNNNSVSRVVISPP